MGAVLSVTKSVAVGDLDRSVVGALQKVVGRTLPEIIDRALDGELGTRDELTDPDPCIGGEVRLRFDGDQDLFVSWVENDGWEHHFSLGGREASHFTSGSLQEWDTTDLPPWSRSPGPRLSSARILGSDGTPHIVELAFKKARVAPAPRRDTVSHPVLESAERGTGMVRRSASSA